VLQAGAAEYDVVVTHFFLDCFNAADLNVLVERTARSAAPSARWIVSEFRPATACARLLIAVMYAFFRGATGLATRRLADHHPHLLRQGFRLQRAEKAWGGMLASELWVR
jgi:class 3 adenylate cyclase